VDPSQECGIAPAFFVEERTAFGGIKVQRRLEQLF